MEQEVAEKLKTIDNEISKALNTITELEEKLTTIRVDEEGNVLKDECEVLKEKFVSFNKSIDDLTLMLVDIGIISENEAKEI